MTTNITTPEQRNRWELESRILRGQLTEAERALIGRIVSQLGLFIEHPGHDDTTIVTLMSETYRNLKEVTR